jgi:hypothetical protein
LGAEADKHKREARGSTPIPGMGGETKKKGVNPEEDIKKQRSREAERVSSETQLCIKLHEFPNDDY